MPTLETHDGYQLWHYIPSLPAAIIFTILFGVATFLHIFKMFQNRTWFCIPFVIGGFFETVGYIGRAMAYNATGDLGPYIMQSTLLLLAPIMFAATLYMTLGRTVLAVHGEQYSFIPPRWLTRTFVTGDCFSFLVQASGAGLIVRAGMGDDSASSPKLGQNIIIGGLILQILMFGVFGVLAISFNVRFGRSGGSRSKDVPWQRTLLILYITSACIMVRNIFRVVQYVMGQSGLSLTHEWCTYVFDAVLMLSVMIVFGWSFLGRMGRTSKLDIHNDDAMARRNGNNHDNKHAAHELSKV